MERIITDKGGRKLSLRRVGVLETLRLYKALGPELSINEAYMGLATIAAAVGILDGVPLPFPNSEASIESLLERLGEDGDWPPWQLRSNPRLKMHWLPKRETKSASRP